MTATEFCIMVLLFVPVLAEAVRDEEEKALKSTELIE